MRTLIIDDEKHALDSLIKDISEYCPELEIIGALQSPIEAIDFIHEHQPELVLSDIQMPEMSVFGMVGKLQWKNFALILVTAYNKYAIKAFEFSAIDYLLKPVDSNKLKSAVVKAKAQIRKDNIEDRLSMIIHNLKFTNHENISLAIPTTHGAELVQVLDIIRIEAQASYSTIHLKNETKLMVSKPLKHFYEILVEHPFLRTHQSHLINTKFIKSYNKGKQGSVQLVDGTVIPISRSFKPDVINFIYGEE